MGFLGSSFRFLRNMVDVKDRMEKFLEKSDSFWKDGILRLSERWTKVGNVTRDELSERPNIIRLTHVNCPSIKQKLNLSWRIFCSSRLRYSFARKLKSTRNFKYLNERIYPHLGRCMRDEKVPRRIGIRRVPIVRCIVAALSIFLILLLLLLLFNLYFRICPAEHLVKRPVNQNMWRSIW